MRLRSEHCRRRYRPQRRECHHRCCQGPCTLSDKFLSNKLWWKWRVYSPVKIKVARYVIAVRIFRAFKQIREAIIIRVGIVVV